MWLRAPWSWPSNLDFREPPSEKPLWETGWCPNLIRPGEKAERANQLLPGLILLQTVPHARAGDETLRFDFAASQAIPRADKPSGTPLQFEMDNRHCCSARESSQENFSRRKLAHSMSRQFLILWIRQTLRATTMSGEVERLSSLRVARQQMEKRKCRQRATKGRSTGCGVERRAVHYRNAGGRAERKHLFW